MTGNEMTTKLQALEMVSPLDEVNHLNELNDPTIYRAVTHDSLPMDCFHFSNAVFMGMQHSAGPTHAD
jgi:hypothetical protein